MELVHTGEIFVAKSTFEERHIPKAAGFRWNPKEKRWWTDNIEKASKLVEYASNGAKEAIEAHKAKQAESRELSRANNADIEIPVPAGLAYLPYQKAAIAYAMQRPSTLFADEMGLGKGVETIGVINADPTVRRVLIVCPASLKINWQREFQKWSVRPYSIGIANGGKFPESDVVICNYDILTKNLEAIQAVQWDVLIADECHYAKNKKAQRSKALYAIQAKRRLFLTGTPIVNRPVELFPIVNALDPKTFGNFMDYAKRYCDATKNRFGWDFSGASNLEELQDKLRTSIMVRRLKKDVLTELPAKRRQVIEFPANGCSTVIRAEMDAAAKHEETLAILRARVALADAADDEEGYKEAVEELRHGTRTAFTEMSQLRHETAVAKIPYVIEHVKECIESSGKVIVFAHHIDVLNALTEAFGAEAVCLQGNTPQKERQEAVDRFQNDPNVKVFVGSITAAGVGITLTAASHVIFAELDWVPGNVTQAEDRAHRIGQQNSVLVQHLVLEGSLDATMARTIVNKQEAIDGALNDQYSVEDLENEALREIRNAADDAAAEAQYNAEHPKPERKPRKQRAQEVFTEQQISAMNAALNTLVDYCDGAQKRDGAGFNQADAYIGRQLAFCGIETAGQAELAKKILKKYHRQIGDSLMCAIYGENWNKRKG